MKIKVGDRVLYCDSDDLYIGNVVGLLPTRNEVVVVWSGNGVGARQAVCVSKLSILKR